MQNVIHLGASSIIVSHFLKHTQQGLEEATHQRCNHQTQLGHPDITCSCTTCHRFLQLTSEWLMAQDLMINWVVVAPPMWKICSSNWITSPGIGWFHKTHLKPPPTTVRKSRGIFEVPWNLNWSLGREMIFYFGLNQLISEECWKKENDSTSSLQTNPTLPKTLVIGMPGGQINFIWIWKADGAMVANRNVENGFFGKTLRLLRIENMFTSR